ncbi:MAG: hypothetical protein B7Z47_02105 [Chthoniobacter sp. 12-60-6]|nr:MAG: hypothetical protein B7Z47_02105 [Chthoniobacter sp. 12-60-6]
MKAAIISTLILTALLAVSAAHAQTPDYTKPSVAVDKFVRDIVLCGRQARTTRWLALPKLQITSSSPTLKDFAQRSFDSFAQATGLTTHVREFADVDIVRRKQPTFVGADAYFYWQNRDQSLKEVLVFVKVIPDKPEEYHQHALFHDMLAGFGFMKNSQQFPDSTFGSGNAFDLQLSALDALLFSFTYKHLPPGSLSSDVTKYLKLHWGK